MKAFAITLFISALLISSISCDPCSEARDYADSSISSLRNHFFNDQYMEIFEDFENVLQSAELMQQSCSVNFAIQSTQYVTCSLAYAMLSELLQNYGFERDTAMVNTLSQIVSLVPTIEGKLCLDAWEVASLQSQQDMDDDIWSDHDASDDYDYDRSDNYDDDLLVEDEEEEDTGDEIYDDSDDEDAYDQEAWTDNDDDKDEFNSEIQADYYDEESEDEEDDLEIEEIEDDTVIQEIPNEEETIMVFVDLSKKADLAVEVEVEEEALLSEQIPATTQEDQDMIMVFVDMTNMANVENSEFAFEGEQEDVLSIYAEISGENGEYTADLYNEDGSPFVYVDVDTSAGVDDVVNAIFGANEDDDDIEVEVDELDLQQYWDDDGDDYY